MKNLHSFTCGSALFLLPIQTWIRIDLFTVPDPNADRGVKKFHGREKFQKVNFLQYSI